MHTKGWGIQKEMHIYPKMLNIPGPLSVSYKKAGHTKGDAYIPGFVHYFRAPFGLHIERPNIQKEMHASWDL